MVNIKTAPYGGIDQQQHIFGHECSILPSLNVKRALTNTHTQCTYQAQIPVIQAQKKKTPGSPFATSSTSLHERRGEVSRRDVKTVKYYSQE